MERIIPESGEEFEGASPFLVYPPTYPVMEGTRVTYMLVATL